MPLLDAKGRPVELRDYDANHVVGIQIGTLGHKLWVCIDGVAVLRVNAPVIELTDHRLGTPPTTINSDLLAACKEALNIKSRVQTQVDVDAREASLKMIKAAIAKAEETPAPAGPETPEHLGSGFRVVFNDSLMCLIDDVGEGYDCHDIAKPDGATHSTRLMAAEEVLKEWRNKFIFDAATANDELEKMFEDA